MGAIHIRIPEFNHAEEEEKSRAFQIPADHSNSEDTGCFVQPR